MRFLADENIPGDAVAEIEAAGRDIVWVRTVAPGSKDEDVLAWAVREERIILTSTRILVNSPGVQDCRRHRALY
jgi:predicted nuclease of predicted toxin-antitoxin system